MKFSQFYNPVMITLLRSPLHGIISGQFVLLSIIGRKSGKQIVLPVEYVRDGQMLVAFTQPTRVWWKNLQGGATLDIRLQGQNYTAYAVATVNDIEAFRCAIAVYLRHFPNRAGLFGVQQAADGTLDESTTATAAAKFVTLQITVQEPRR